MGAILLTGPTGSGKTPLGNWLASNGWLGRRCRHFDFGAHLRAGTGLTAQERGFVDGLLALVQRKLAIFAERTAPLEAYYRARGTPIWPVQVGAQTSAAQMAAQLGWCAPAQ